jgi:GTP cyclohydrolase I
MIQTMRVQLAHHIEQILRWVEPPVVEDCGEAGHDENCCGNTACLPKNAQLREGLQETPERAAKAWEFWTRGYSIDVPGLLKTFEDGANGVDEMVVVKNIPLYSKCEHHLADIFGTATVAYIPFGKVVGLSKISRVVDAYARRLQVQERLTNQIADAIWQNLGPLGVGVHIKARHMCMESRGICQQGHHTETTALRGVFKTDSATRAEFIGAMR